MDWVGAETRDSATAILAHNMVVLEMAARTAEAGGHFMRADGLWKQRQDLQHQRSLLMRELWRLMAPDGLAPGWRR